MFQSSASVLSSKVLWISAIIGLIYLYLKKVVHSYWQRHKIPYDDYSLITGIFGRDFFTQKISLGNIMKRSYEKMKKYPFHGIYMFHNRVLMVNDPKLLKQILVKDFTHFCDRGLYSNYKVDPMSAHLFALSGDKWRTLRAKLVPTFTVGKLKQMFFIMQEIADEMIRVADENLVKSNIIEFKDLIARYTTDTIFSLAFGLDSKCLREPDNEFRHYGSMTVENDIIRGSLGFFAPGILDLFQIPFIQPYLSQFYIKLFYDMVDKRRKENVNRNDFLDALIHLMDHEQIVDKDMVISADGISAEKIAKKLEPLEAAAQAFVFFIAGFETSASIATHCLYELALNPDVQEKVHEEIDELLQHSKLTYENIMQLEYLDMVFYETMRKHPSLPFLNRVCIDDYKIPNSSFIIPKGMGIIISVSGLHSDPDFYPEPQKFDPSRFSKENMASRDPCIYLAFGEGPRICIGKRLGILQTKMAVFYLLSKYKVSVCEKTPIPNQYSLKSVLQTPKDGIYLKVEKRPIY